MNSVRVWLIYREVVDGVKTLAQTGKTMLRRNTAVPKKLVTKCASPPPMTTKQELESQLTNAKNNYILGLAAISLFSSKPAYDILDKNSASFGTYTVSFDQVSNMLRIPQDREIAIKEFFHSQLRVLIKESFELVKNYCDKTGQLATFKAEPWYQFARMIRNTLSHNFQFEFNSYDKTLLPVSWKSLTIDSSFDGQYLKTDFFGYVQTWELFGEFQSLVTNRLT